MEQPSRRELLKIFKDLLHGLAAIAITPAGIVPAAIAHLQQVTQAQETPNQKDMMVGLGKAYALALELNQPLLLPGKVNDIVSDNILLAIGDLFTAPADTALPKIELEINGAYLELSPEDIINLIKGFIVTFWQIPDAEQTTVLDAQVGLLSSEDMVATCGAEAAACNTTGNSFLPDQNWARSLIHEIFGHGFIQYIYLLPYKEGPIQTEVDNPSPDPGIPDTVIIDQSYPLQPGVVMNGITPPPPGYEFGTYAQSSISTTYLYEFLAELAAKVTQAAFSRRVPQNSWEISYTWQDENQANLTSSAYAQIVSAMAGLNKDGQAEGIRLRADWLSALRHGSLLAQAQVYGSIFTANGIPDLVTSLIEQNYGTYNEAQDPYIYRVVNQEWPDVGPAAIQGLVFIAYYSMLALYTAYNARVQVLTKQAGVLTLPALNEHYYLFPVPDASSGEIAFKTIWEALDYTRLFFNYAVRSSWAEETQARAAIAILSQAKQPLYKSALGDICSQLYMLIHRGNEPSPEVQRTRDLLRESVLWEIVGVTFAGQEVFPRKHNNTLDSVIGTILSRIIDPSEYTPTPINPPVEIAKAGNTTVLNFNVVADIQGGPGLQVVSLLGTQPISESTWQLQGLVPVVKAFAQELITNILTYPLDADSVVIPPEQDQTRWQKIALRLQTDVQLSDKLFAALLQNNFGLFVILLAGIESSTSATLDQFTHGLSMLNDFANEKGLSRVEVVDSYTALKINTSTGNILFSDYLKLNPKPNFGDSITWEMVVGILNSEAPTGEEIAVLESIFNVSLLAEI